MLIPHRLRSVLRMTLSDIDWKTVGSKDFSDFLKYLPPFWPPSVQSENDQTGTPMFVLLSQYRVESQ